MLRQYWPQRHRYQTIRAANVERHVAVGTIPVGTIFRCNPVGHRRQNDLSASGRVVLSSREHPIMLEPFGKGVRAVALRYPREVRNESIYFEDISDAPVSKELLELASTIVESKAADFDPSEFVDHYEDALVAMLEDKKAGRPVKAVEPSKPSNVVNLADALRAAARDAQGKKPAKPKTAAAKQKKPAKKAA